MRIRYHCLRKWNSYTAGFAIALALISFAQAGAVHAAPTAQVYRLQMPAWIERLGQRYPVRSGMELRENDAVETGSSGRVWIRFSDESLLKIGSDTRVEIDNLDLDRGTRGILQGIMHFIGGVFRYTAAATSNKSERNLNIRVATMTVGIRGTDIWGRVKKEGGMVCLIEGEIRVQPANDNGFEMDKALTFAKVSKTGKVAEIEKVKPDQLRKWAQLTELVDGTGLSSSQGTWVVNLVSYQNQAAVLDIEDRLQKAGFAVEYSTVTVKGKIYYRLSVPQLESRKEARSLAKRLANKHEIRTPWVENSAPLSTQPTVPKGTK